MTDKELEKIKIDYMKGNTYNEIQKKNNITNSQLIYLIRKEKWKRPSNRSEVHKGNKNAKGNKGGHAPYNNKNALVTGEYENIFSSVLDDEEQGILVASNLGTKETLMGELKILTIRERRMLGRIQELKNKHKDMVITRINKGGENNSIEVQNILFLIGKIEDSLTRVQESKRRMLDLLYKIECDNGAIVEKPNEVALKQNIGILDSINKQLLGGGLDG